MNIGFIGLGTMGLPMVKSLAAVGHLVFVHDTNPEAMANAQNQASATVCKWPSEVAEKTEVLFTCLPDDAIVQDVYLGTNGIVKGARKGLITCDTSTVSAETTIALAKKLEISGITHLDTPMLGSLPQAIAGEIFFIVGGDTKAINTIGPLLDVMGRKRIHTGAIGSANVIKLIHNSLAAVTAVAVSESLAVCKTTGVDPRIFYEVVSNGGGMAYSNYFDRRVSRMLDGEFSPTFSLALMLKDIGLGCQIADRQSVQTPMMKEALITFKEASEEGWGQDDFSAVSRIAEKRLGKKIFPKV